MSEVKQKAAKAKRELKLTGEAFDTIRANAIERMIAADLVDGDSLRARMAAIVQVVDGVRSVLNSAIDSGKIEDHSDEMNKLMEAPNA